MAADAIALFQALLLEDIHSKIVDQLEFPDLLLEDVLNTEGTNKVGITVDAQNNKFQIASKTGRMTAYEGATSASLINSSISSERMYVVPYETTASFLVEHNAIALASKNRATLEPLVMWYSTDVRKAINRARGRHLRGDGTGIVGVLPVGAQSSATITISAQAAGTVASANRYGLGALKMFAPGDKLEFGTETAFGAGTQVTGTVLTVNSDTSITLTGSVSIGNASSTNNRTGSNAGTWYVRFSGTNVLGTNYTPMGLLGLVDDGTCSPAITTIQSLTRSTTPYMKSVTTVKPNAATLIEDMTNLYNTVTTFSPKVKVWVLSTDLILKYSNSITVMYNAMVNPGQGAKMSYESKIGVGHAGLEFAFLGSPIPVVQDKFLPYGTALLLDTDELFMAEVEPISFLPGHVMLTGLGSKNYETAMVSNYNFGTFGSRRLGGRLHYETV